MAKQKKSTLLIITMIIAGTIILMGVAIVLSLVISAIPRNQQSALSCQPDVFEVSRGNYVETDECIIKERMENEAQRNAQEGAEYQQWINDERVEYLTE